MFLESPIITQCAKFEIRRQQQRAKEAETTTRDEIDRRAAISIASARERNATELHQARVRLQALRIHQPHREHVQRDNITTDSMTTWRMGHGKYSVC